MKSYIKVIKNILYLTSFTFILSCSTDPNDTPVVDHQIIGSWEWIESFGGFAGQLITPESAGYTRTIVLKSNGIFTDYKDNEENFTADFEIEQKPAWGEGSSIEDILIIADYTLEQIIDFQSNDTLHLTEICYDCYDHYYIRIDND